MEDQQTPNSNRDRRLDGSKLYKYTICNMQTTLGSTIQECWMRDRSLAVNHQIKHMLLLAPLEANARA
jgi:hypothetical protein